MGDVASIAFVCPRFADGPTVGGAETLMKVLAGYATAAGLDVTFLTTCAQNHFTWANELEPGTREVGGITVRYFPVNTDRNIGAFLHVQERISHGSSVSADDEKLWLEHNVNSRELIAHLAASSTSYDRVIIGPYLFGLSYFAAQAAGDRAVLVPCLHDEPFAYLEAFRDMFNDARTIMFNAGPERELAARLYGEALGGMPVVGMGLSPFDADPHAFAKRRGINAPYVIFSGRREPLKGTPLLLDYLDVFRARTGRDIKLVLTGSGDVPYPPALAPHVIDVGFVSEEEKHEAMAGAVAFCHPSVNESFGIVLLESWLARTPALVHGAGAVLRDQAKQSNAGLWFRTYPEFEESLTLLMDRQDLRDAMGQAGRTYVLKEYTHERVTERLLAALEL